MTDVLQQNDPSKMHGHENKQHCNRHRQHHHKPNFSSGREFYDDGYTEEEQNAAELPTTMIAGSVPGLSTHVGRLGGCTEDTMGGGHVDGQHGTASGDDDDESPSPAAGVPSSSPNIFFGMQKELKKLHQIRDCIIHGTTFHRRQQPNDDDDNDDDENKTTPFSGSNQSRGTSTKEMDTATIPSTTASSLGTDLERDKLLPAVLVWGVSGTGKSRLVDQFLQESCTCIHHAGVQEGSGDETGEAGRPPRHDLTCCSCCYVLRGKYDECTGGSDPFSAIVQALNDFSRQLHNGSKEELERMRVCVRQAFASDEKLQQRPSTNTNPSNVTMNKASSNMSCDNSTSHRQQQQQQQHEGGDETSRVSSSLRALISVIPSLSILLPPTDMGMSMSMSMSMDKQGSHNTHGNSSNELTHDRGSQMDDGNDGVSVSVASAVRQRQTAQSAPGKSFDSAWKQLQFIFQKFVKAICTPQKPVYFFIDDLQWSSTVSFDLLAGLIADPEMRNFMFLGIIRQETDPHSNEAMELTEDAPLRTCFLDVLSARKLEQITIHNLSPRNLTKLVSELLDRPAEDVAVLSKKLYAKTQGNVYFTLQALEELERKNILIYSRIFFQWEWNLGDDEELPVSDNIVSAIESKLKELPEQLQLVLSVAAYIRASFDLQTLWLVLQNEAEHAAGVFSTMPGPSSKEGAPVSRKSFQEHAVAKLMDANEVSHLLEQAVLERLILNPIGGSNYRFAHDRIQQAAYGMIPYGEQREMLRVRIGHCLLDHYRALTDANQSILDSSPPPTNNDTDQANDADGLLFVAADHLNSVQCKDHMFSVVMNLEVGEKALQMAALAPAAGYLQKATNALRRVQNPWDEHYSVCFRLYSARSAVELSLGHFDVGYKLGYEAIDKARSLDEKLPIYLSIMHSLGRENRHLEAFKIGISTMRQIKEFPKRFLAMHAVAGLSKVKAYFKAYTDEDILNLPLIQDPRKAITVKFCNEVGIRAHLCKSMLKLVVNHFISIQITFEYGLSVESAMAITASGMMGLATGDFEFAIRCGDLAHRVVRKTNGTAVAGWVTMVTSLYIDPYTVPLTDIIQRLRTGYMISMEAGEFEVGFMNWQISNVFAFFAGYELRPLLKAAEITHEQYRMYRVESMIGTSQAFLTLFRVLSGAEPPDWDKLEEQSRRNLKKEKLDGSETYELIPYFQTTLILAVYMRRHHIAQGLLKCFNLVSSEDTSLLTIAPREFFGGLVYANLYRETGKKKHLRKMQKLHKQLRTVTTAKGPNCLHYPLILDAEELAIRKGGRKVRSVKNAYDKAIAVAARSSYIQDAGLACEMAGEYFVLHGQKELATEYLSKSVQYFRAWDCVLKVDDIKQRRSEYIRDLSMEGGGLPGIRSHGILSGTDGDMMKHTSERTKIDLVSTYTPTKSHVAHSMKSVSQSASEEADQSNSHRVETEQQDIDIDHVSVLTDAS